VHLIEEFEKIKSLELTTIVEQFALFCENQSGYEKKNNSNSPGFQIGRFSYIQQQPIFTSGFHNLIIKNLIN
jgi:hypothetical protein